MKLIGKIAMLAVAGAVAFTACKKKDDGTGGGDPGPTKTQKEYLTEGKWQLTSLPIDVTITTPFGNNTQSYNQYDSMEACEKDNYTKFMASNKVYTYEGATKCSTSDPDIDSTETWTLSSDSKKMTFSTAGNQTFDVQELTSSALKLYNKLDTTYTTSGITITSSSKTTLVFKNIN
jgi:hypothetical protein